jgi:PAS domain S-box-containing protein
VFEQSSVPTTEGRKDLDGPEDILQLHEISTLLVQDGNLDFLHNRILDAAIAVMSSDMASLQLLDPESNNLRLLASKGFHPQSAIFWECVYLNSACTCGIALSSGSRVVVPDVETCDFMAGTPDLDEYRRSNIRAVQSTPLISRSGQLLGMISTHWREPHQPQERALRRLDVIARQAADLIERGRTEARLGGLLTLSYEPMFVWQLDGPIEFWNAGAERLYGFAPEEAIGHSSHALLQTKFPVEFAELITQLRNKRYWSGELRHICKDGHEVIVESRQQLLRDGTVIEVNRDVTERTQIKADLRESEQQLRWLAREAEHRSKNLLANVQAMVDLSQADAITDLKKAIKGRIQALANVHSLFVATRWVGAELSTIAEQELAPYSATGEKRVRIDGPQVLLEPNTAQAVAVVLHELATNAAKYGALSTANGHIDVKWSEKANGRLNLRWIETGGPPVQPPTVRGFGGRVIEQMIGQLKGKTRFGWRAEGLVCEITLPVAHFNGESNRHGSP